MGLRVILLLLLASCATPVIKDPAFDQLWEKVSMEGEGRARLEVGTESWAFSFDAIVKENDWISAISIPLHGEEVFSFPGLQRATPGVVISKDDFRWQIEAALEAASRERKLNYPELGRDFVLHFHHLLRWVHAEKWGLSKSCAAEGETVWSCRWDELNSSWAWNPQKEEFTGEFILRSSWIMRVVFKNLTDQRFKRVTLEIIRENELKQFVELRQEFFFR